MSRWGNRSLIGCPGISSGWSSDSLRTARRRRPGRRRPISTRSGRPGPRPASALLQAPVTRIRAIARRRRRRSDRAAPPDALRPAKDSAGSRIWLDEGTESPAAEDRPGRPRGAIRKQRRPSTRLVARKASTAQDRASSEKPGTRANSTRTGLSIALDLPWGMQRRLVRIVSFPVCKIVFLACRRTQDSATPLAQSRSKGQVP